MDPGYILFIVPVAVWAIGRIISKLQDKGKIGYTNKKDAEYLKNLPPTFTDDPSDYNYRGDHMGRDD